LQIGELLGFTVMKNPRAIISTIIHTLKRTKKGAELALQRINSKNKDERDKSQQA